MGLFRQKFNPISGQLNLVPTATIVTFKEAVANAAALPLVGNIVNDGRITNDTGHLYIWSGTAWVDQGDIINLEWTTIDGRPISLPIDIDDAVSKKHTQGTDQGLDTGGVNAVTAAQTKAGYTHSGVTSGNPHNVSKTDVGLGNVDNKSEATIITDVKADTDIADALSKRHTQNTDTILDQGGSNQVSASEIITLMYNVILNSFRIAQIGSLTIFSMIKGFMDEYEDESGIDLVNSTNQVYDAIDDYYHPYPGAAGSNILVGGTPSADAGTSSYGAGNACDGNLSTFWESSWAGYAWWKYDLGSGNAKIVQTFKVYPYAGFGFNGFEIRGSNNDSNWTTLFTGNCPNSEQWHTFNIVNTNAYRYYKVQVTSGYGGFNTIYEFEMIDAPAVPQNMTLISNSQSADATPTSTRIVIFEEDVDAIILNTDLKAYVSRDGGTTFTQTTLEDEGNYITSARVLAGIADLSSQPSGTSMVYKITTDNLKDLKIHGTAISWK